VFEPSCGLGGGGEVEPLPAMQGATARNNQHARLEQKDSPTWNNRICRPEQRLGGVRARDAGGGEGDRGPCSKLWRPATCLDEPRS
jgi:hypothetical protein